MPMTIINTESFICLRPFVKAFATNQFSILDKFMGNEQERNLQAFIFLSHKILYLRE